MSALLIRHRAVWPRGRRGGEKEVDGADEGGRGEIIEEEEGWQRAYKRKGALCCSTMWCCSHKGMSSPAALEDAVISAGGVERQMGCPRGASGRLGWGHRSRSMHVGDRRYQTQVLLPWARLRPRTSSFRSWRPRHRGQEAPQKRAEAEQCHMGRYFNRWSASIFFKGPKSVQLRVDTHKIRALDRRPASGLPDEEQIWRGPMRMTQALRRCGARCTQ